MSPASSRPPPHATAARRIVEIGRRFYERGWVLGTSGNFSAVTSRDPLRLAITSRGAHKGTLTARQILAIDAEGDTLDGAGRSSAETRLHLLLVADRGAGAVLHTHSVWSTILSDIHAGSGGIALRGYEMLKGLDGVTTHEHREWVPIVANDQDMTRLAGVVRERLADSPPAHAFLLARHGLYTWGATLADAERHVEILEFLFEAEARRQSWRP